jgi:Rad3-related DNA helicase
MNKYSNLIADRYDLKEKLQREQSCAYFFSIERIERSDIIVLPYVYLLDWEINSLCKNIIRDSIIVFDEGHNLLSSACDGASFDINTESLKKVLQELNLILSIEDDIRKTINHFFLFVSSLENLFYSDFFFEKLKKFNQIPIEKIETMFLWAVNDMSNTVVKENFIQTDLENKAKQQFNFKYLIDLVTKILDFFDSRDFSEFRQEVKSTSHVYISILNSISFLQKLNMINLILTTSKCKKDLAQFCIFPEMLGEIKTLNIVCLNSNVTLNNIAQKNPRCLMVCSGTLTPFENFEKLSGIKFPIKFSCGHVITSPSQVLILI